MFLKTVIVIMLYFPILLMALGGTGLPAVMVNGNPIKGDIVSVSGNKWHFHYKREFAGAQMPAWAEELRLNQSQWKFDPAHPDISGYNGDITVKLELPGNPEELSVAAQYVNYSDRRVRTFRISFSLDGIEYMPFAKGSGAGGAANLSGLQRLSGNAQRSLWLRFSRELEAGDATGMRGNVVLKSLSISLKGDAEFPLNSANEKVALTSNSSSLETLKNVTLVLPDSPAHIPRQYSTDYMVAPLNNELTQKVAAERLQMLITRALGKRPLIVPASAAPKSGTRIFVGYGPHLQGIVSPPAAPEGIRIVEKQGDLFILGEIAPAGTNNFPTAVDRGLMHAVETFAEEVMGYRFLHSPIKDEAMFELGTVVPDLDRLTIKPGLRIEDAPVFRHRLITSSPLSGPLIGLRTGSTLNFSCNHSYGEQIWARAYAEKHPEMFINNFAKTSDGDKARAKAMNNQNSLYYLDYTEPLVLEKRLEHLEGWFKNRSHLDFFAGRAPTDTYILEEPPDVPPPAYRYNARSNALWNPDHGQYGQFSAIWFDYLRRLSAEAKKRWPKMRIAAAAYMSHWQPPKFDLPDNLDISLCMMRPSTQCKEPYVFNRNLEAVKMWHDKLGGNRDRLVLWEYGCWPSWFIATPLNYPYSIQRWLRAIKPYVSGAFIEHYGPVEQNFLMRRVWLRLLWNPELDVASEIEDVCSKFFGPSGKTMTAFHRLLAERYEAPWKNPQLIWDQYYVAPELYYGQSFPPGELTRLASMLDQACREAGLPSGIEAVIRHGCAIYVPGDEGPAKPMQISLIAGADELVNPVIGWDKGRLSWIGRLGPGERLEINAAGQVAHIGPDGASSPVNAVVTGKLPMPGQSEVFYFWHKGEQNALFRVSLRRSGEPEEHEKKKDIYARRLAWLRKAYQVFEPAKANSANGYRGFFVDAHVAHQHLNGVPALEAPAISSADLKSIDWNSVPSAALVRGKKNSDAPWLIMGYPADMQTKFRFVHTPDALIMQLDAEGKPLPGEKVTIYLGKEVFEFAPGQTNPGSPLSWTFSACDNGWQAVAVMPWKTLKIENLKRPAELPLQVTRARGEDHYLWSPPMAAWGHNEQGPGKLRMTDAKL